MMDNASNNDTLMEALETRCHNAGIEFSASAAHIQCIPHTIHLAAIKVYFSLFSPFILNLKQHLCTEAAEHVKAAIQKVCVLFHDSFFISITILASENCLLSMLDSSASRELGKTDPNHKFTEQHIPTTAHAYSGRQNSLVINSSNASYVWLLKHSFYF